MQAGVLLEPHDIGVVQDAFVDILKGVASRHDWDQPQVDFAQEGLGSSFFWQPPPGEVGEIIGTGGTIDLGVAECSGVLDVVLHRVLRWVRRWESQTKNSPRRQQAYKQAEKHR